MQNGIAGAAIGGQQRRLQRVRVARPFDARPLRQLLSQHGIRADAVKQCAIGAAGAAFRFIEPAQRWRLEPHRGALQRRYQFPVFAIVVLRLAAAQAFADVRGQRQQRMLVQRTFVELRAALAKGACQAFLLAPTLLQRAFGQIGTSQGLLQQRTGALRGWRRQFKAVRVGGNLDQVVIRAEAVVLQLVQALARLREFLCFRDKASQQLERFVIGQCCARFHGAILCQQRHCAVHRLFQVGGDAVAGSPAQ